MGKGSEEGATPLTGKEKRHGLTHGDLNVYLINLVFLNKQVVVSEIKLYELLKAKIGEREAEAFIEILENKVETKLTEKTAICYKRRHR